MKNNEGLLLDQFGAKAILDALADGAYITDRARRIIYWNRAAERITGWPASEVVGRSCRENILVHEDKDGHRLCADGYCPLHRSITTGRSSDRPLLVFAQARSGARVPVWVTVSPLRDASGTVVGGVELFREAEEDVAEMARARVIQENTLRCPLPIDPRVRFATRYLPRNMVGGDFFRVEHVRGSRYAVFAADVAGHGVASALYTMQLRALWEDLRAELASPGRHLAALNRRVRAVAPEEGYFATAVLLVLDAATGDVVQARAGHPPPLAFRGPGRVSYAGECGPALGLLPDAAYPEEAFALEVGQGLLVYTDGAVEVEDARGAELGIDGLVRLAGDVAGAAAVPDLEQLEKALLAYSGCVNRNDDVTLITVERL